MSSWFLSGRDREGTSRRACANLASTLCMMVLEEGANLHHKQDFMARRSGRGTVGGSLCPSPNQRTGIRR